MAFTYLKVIGWGWFYLSTILDDYSRYIIAWKLCTNMTADDVTATLKLALEASGCNRANVVHKPRLLSDNGSSYISGALAEWLEDHGMDHVRGAPYHPQTQGKIERWHQTLKNRIRLENYYLPGDLENQISAFADHYNNQRYHESIGNVTPADAYFGRHTAIIEKRKRIKKLTTQNRRFEPSTPSGLTSNKDEPDPPYETRSTVPFVLMTDTGRGPRHSHHPTPCDWHGALFGALMAVPADGQPVTKHASLDDGFLEVARAIREIAGPGAARRRGPRRAAWRRLRTPRRNRSPFKQSPCSD